MSVAKRIPKLRVFAWGDSKVGPLGGRKIKKYSIDKPLIFDIPNPTVVTAGWSHNGILSSDGLSYVLGRTHDIKNVFYISRMFRLTCRLLRVWKSIESPTPRYITFPEDHLPKDDPIISIDTSACLTGIVTESGKAFLYGDNRHGQCGNGEPCERVWDPSPLVGIREEDRIESIALGFSHGLAMTRGGAVYAWGKGERGQLGIKGAQSSEFAKIIPAFDHERELPKVKELPVETMMRIGGDGGANTMGTQISDGNTDYIAADTLFENLGDNNNGNKNMKSSVIAQRKYAQLQTSNIDHSSFRLENESFHAIKIKCGLNHSACVTNKGDLLIWGKYCSSQVDEESSRQNKMQDQFVPRKLNLTSKALDVACGQFHTTALTADGSLWVCGFQTAAIAKRRAMANDEEYDELDVLSRFIPQPERVDLENSQIFYTDGEEIVKLEAGWGTNVAVTNHGYVYEYDWDEPPRRVKGLEDIFVHDIGLGWQHTIVIGEKRK
eukprot:g7219.t1